MTFINSFLQRKKLREYNYGIYMVLAAYVLSILLLIIGSDTLYNITSKADGLNTQSNEVNQAVLSEEGQGFISLYGTTDTVEDYHQVEYRHDYKQKYLRKYQEYQENNQETLSVSDDTNWLLGYAMNNEEYEHLLVHMNQSEVFLENEADSISSFSTTDLVKEDNKSSTSKIGGITVAKDEIKMLEQIVEAEATGEDIIGKILVANVVVNRALDDAFPDTIEDVIFQKVGDDYQFSPIADKRYWKVKVTEETKEAVQRAISGEDHSEGALYFMARKLAKKSNTRWFDNNLKWLFKHGAHEFFR